VQQGCKTIQLSIFKRERAKNLPFRPYYLLIASISSPYS